LQLNPFDGVIGGGGSAGNPTNRALTDAQVEVRIVLALNSINTAELLIEGGIGFQNTWIYTNG
jgi:hypothetical protein